MQFLAAVALLSAVLFGFVSSQDLGRLDDDLRGSEFGADRAWLFTNRLRYFKRYDHPTHMVVCPRTLRPSTIYRCIVSILFLDHPVDVRTSIQRDGVEITHARADIIKGYPQTMLLQIPSTVSPGEYRLRVEGNHQGSVGGSIFSNSTLLHFDTRFLTILIQANRPVYSGSQMVRFRIILLTTEQKPYDDPVDVYILDPDGYVMRRWPSQPTNVGVVSMGFMLPFLPKEGWWTVRAVVKGQVQDKKFRVTKWYTPRFETKVYMQKYFLETDEFIIGSVEGEFANDKGVYGNGTFRLYARTERVRDWNLVSTMDVEVFDGEYEYELPMEDVVRSIGGASEGAMIRVEVELHDAFMNLNQTGWAEAKVINSSVNCEFIGSPPFVVVPGMPFHATVGVSYHDTAPLSKDKLANSSLVIKAEASLETGGSETVLEIVIPKLQDERRDNRVLDRVWRTKKRRKSYISEQGLVPGEISEYDYYEYYEYNDKHLDYDYDKEYSSHGSTPSRSPYSGLYSSYRSYSDPATVRKLSEAELVEKKLEIYLRNVQFQSYREKGVFELVINVPPKTKSLTMTASYSDEDGAIAGATAQAIAYYSSKKEYLSIETSTKNAKVGEFAIFHVRANYHPESFHYLVMAKEILLYSSLSVFDASEGGSVKTLSIPVSAEMAPSFKLVVYDMAQHYEMIADSITVPVDGISRHNVTLVLNKDKDHTLRSLELGTYSTAGAFYGMSGVRTFAFAMQAGNELSHASVMEELYAFNNDTRSIHRMRWRDREGLIPAEAKYFVAPNYGPDANRTFDFSGLIIFTDGHVGTLPGYAESRCNETEGYSPCLTAGCYPTVRKCDGTRDCADGYDEANCVTQAEDFAEIEFRIHQFLWFADLFDAEDGDWNWLDYNIGYKGHEMTTIELNKVNDPYIVTAFSISPEEGFGLIPKPFEFLSLPPMYITLEMPEVCRRGEQVGARVMIFNTVPKEFMIMLILHGSEDYGFVNVNPDGEVDYFAPKVTTGDHQHLISVDPEGSVEVIFPIVALVDQGEIEVTVSAITQIGRDSQSVTLTIEPEGAMIDRHTSVLLDLKNRALVYEHLDIIIDESYEIPRSLRRRFVAGSPRGHLALSGDIIGPTFPEGTPVDAEQLLRKKLRGTEASAFNFGANLWTLHYLRLTNQLDYIKHRDAFDRLNVELAAVMYRFDSSGAFRMWDNSAPSVWLTAWTVRLLQQAQFQDWENLIYIQPEIIDKGVSFLLRYQDSESGAFMETPAYQNTPLSQKTSPYSFGLEWRGQRNISLTAQVLLTLDHSINSLQGSVRARASNAKIRAQRYLERELPYIRDPYEMAIVAYALSIVNSVDKGEAFNKLDNIKREQNGLVYWSREEIETNARVYENNQRNLLQPKFESKWDAHAVEATSYALLVYLIRDGINIIQERIVEWLTAMRMHDGGFISTVDTLVAMQALTEYSYRARLRDITSMRVTLEATGEKGSIRNNVSINTQDISQMNKIPITNVWGMVNVVAHGAGQAVLQLDVSYGIDWTRLKKQPPVEAFDMTVRENFSKYGNKSIATVEICAKWIHLDESSNSGAAVIEVENPTGYVAFQLDAERSIAQARRTGSFPTLRDVRGGDGDGFYTHTVWYFDYIPGNASYCFQYSMRRWYPVANLTSVRMATIYEQYQPERFQVVMFNSSVFSLDVCEVCGSYQCPYCPIYSSAPPGLPLTLSASLFLPLLLQALYSEALSNHWRVMH